MTEANGPSVMRKEDDMAGFTINIDDRFATKFFSNLENKQLPYVVANAFNKTMVDAQTEVKQVAYVAAFVQRNSSLAKSLTTIRSKDFATRQKQSVTMGAVVDGRTGRVAGDGFIERQMANKVKVAKGHFIAIPITGKGLRRLRGGSIPAKMKPRANKKLFKLTTKQNNTFLVERQPHDNLVFRYKLQHVAGPNKRGKFNYENAAVDTILRKIQANFEAEFIKTVSNMKIKI